jgi:hypothetical protein
MTDKHLNGPVTGASPVAQEIGGTPINHAGIIFPTLARSETGGVAADGVYASAEQFNPGCKGVRLFTVVANGGGTVTVKIQVKNPATGAWVDLAGAATAALNNTAGALLTVYPGLTGIADAAGVTINQHLGSAWRLVVTVATAEETFSVGADYLL